MGGCEARTARCGSEGLSQGSQGTSTRKISQMEVSQDARIRYFWDGRIVAVCDL